MLDAGQVLTSLLEKNTGYDFVSVMPPNETELVRAFGTGNAHIASLSPFGYLLASEKGEAEAALAREQDGSIFYGADFLAASDMKFLNYFDPIQGKNLAEASTALAQFGNKKPCWTDALSPSGYVVPLGILNGAGITTANRPSWRVIRRWCGRCTRPASAISAPHTSMRRTYPGLEDRTARPAAEGRRDLAHSADHPV